MAVEENNIKKIVNREFYGESEDNFMDIISSSQGEIDKNLIVLIHGGYWREKYTYELMTPLADYFSQNGYTVANVEYRRGRNKWPIPNEDVRSSLLYLKKKYTDKKLVIIGHSVGGQLALLNSDLADKIVGLAPVTDLIYTKKIGLGNDAVSSYYGKDVENKLLEEASPLFKDLQCQELLIVHGLNDEAVQIENSFTYIDKQKNHSIDLFMETNLSHMECIDITQKHIAIVKQWIN